MIRGEKQRRAQEPAETEEMLNEGTKRQARDEAQLQSVFANLPQHHRKPGPEGDAVTPPRFGSSRSSLHTQ